MRPKGKLFDLKQLRKDYGLSQKRIADETNTKQSFLSAIERGLRSAPKHLIDSIQSKFSIIDIDKYIKDRPKEPTKYIHDIRDSVVDSPNGKVVIATRGGLMISSGNFGERKSVNAKNQFPNEEENNTQNTVEQLTSMLFESQNKVKDLEELVLEQKTYIEKLLALIPPNKRP